MPLFSRKKPVQPAAPQAAPSTPAPVDAPVSLTGDAAEIEQRTQDLGREMLEAARQHKAGLMTALSDNLMDWAMKDEGFKIQLFRFIDAYPTLTTPEEIHDHLVDYLSQPGVTPPKTIQAALKAGSMAKGLMTSTLSKQIKGMAGKFIAGRDAITALATLRKLWDSGAAFTVDLLGEACVSEEEADAYLAKYMDLVRKLPDAIRDWPANERLDADHLGAIPRTNVSVKISSLAPEIDPIDGDRAIDMLMSRLVPLLEAARDVGAFINFDMEQFAYKDLTLDLFERCCQEVDFEAGVVLQAYLRSGEADAQRMIDFSRRTQRLFSIRLVKGAYWDYETIEAEKTGRPVPVWSVKRDSDACYERMTKMLLSATPHSAQQAEQGGIKLALGSHNMRSIAHAIAVTESLGLPRSALELQMLHGMADQIKAGVDALGMRVREYFPVGEMIPGMAYFVRRLLENTSNESWLRAGFADNVSVETLFANPARSAAELTKDPGIELIEGGPERHALSPAAEGVGDGRPFFSAPHRSFGSRLTRDAFADAIKQVTLPDDDAPATAVDADRALDAAADAFAGWRDAEPHHRARVLIEAGRLIRDRRDQLCGIMIKETGHTWREADNEICEAIDFCEYYARHAVHLFEPRRLGRFIGELNEVVHEPRGVAVIVSPWSHPLSIGCGMAVAALVTGNPIILCPAGQATAMGRALRDVFVEAGVPSAAVHVLARADQSIRDRLVADPRTATIAYAGPAQPSFKVRDEAARDLDEQMQVKEVICDLAGKNAVIVDTSADLDDAVRAIRDAAFSYQGQKHSTCSRAIIVAARYDQFIDRLVGYTRELTIGDPLLATTDIGPLVDVQHADAVRAAIEEGRTTARLALALDLPDDLPNPERYVAPHIFADVRPDQRLAREIIFGPVLSVMRAESFDDALAMANDSPYRLTGGVYSRKPSHIERARRTFRVGNLYINRSIVGSAVGRQPFGGLGLSGVGAMSGGDTYLLQFVSPRTVTENTMRRGFAPEL